MDGSRLLLLRVRGIPIYVDLSWFLIFGLVTWSLATGVFGPAHEELSRSTIWLLAAITAVGFFACVVLHELGHALVGRANGMPIRGITLFLFGGVAELEREPPSARSEFWMAIAGPAVSAVLVVLFAVVALVLRPVEGTGPALMVLDYLVWVNVAVLVFNLVPAFPLDGGRVFRAAVWAWTGNLRQATQLASLTGRGFGYFLVVVGILGLLGGALIQGIWLLFIGMFLANLARRSYEAVVVNELLRGQPVHRFMTPDPVTVSPNVDLRRLVDEYVYRHHRKTFPVVEGGKVVGLVRAEAVRNVPPDEWDRATVGDVMESDVAALRISPRDDAATALRQMQQARSTRLLVVDGENLVGVLCLRDLMEYLDLTQTLGGNGPSANRRESTVV